jgi:hypothetical protein
MVDNADERRRPSLLDIEGEHAACEGERSDGPSGAKAMHNYEFSTE